MKNELLRQVLDIINSNAEQSKAVPNGGPPDICHCGDSGCIRTFEHAIALRDENARFNKFCVELESDVRRLEAENERLTAYIDKLATDNVTVGAKNDAVADEIEQLKSRLAFANNASNSLQRRCEELGAENGRFNKYCLELEADVRRLESENEQLRASSSVPEPPSGPSWLDRVAAGPQRIGIPLP